MGIRELDSDPPATQPVLVTRIAALIEARTGTAHHDFISWLKPRLRAAHMLGARWIASQIPIASKEMISR